MAEKIDCPECGNEVESTDDLETGGEVREMEADDSSVTLFQNHDLFLCKGCKKPLGFERSSGSE